MAVRFQAPRHKTLREWVLDELSERILDGRLPPGCRLVESDLAEQMAISRSPIREALRHLEQEGLVRTLPNSSTVVMPLSLDTFEQLYEIRSALEPLAARRAAEHLTEDDIPLLNAAKLRLEQAYETKIDAEIARADLDLHAVVWACARRPKLNQMLSGLIRHTRRYVAITTHAFSDTDPLVGRLEHFRIVDAVISRDPDLADRCVREHLATGGVRMLASLNRGQDLTAASAG